MKHLLISDDSTPTKDYEYNLPKPSKCAFLHFKPDWHHQY